MKTISSYLSFVEKSLYDKVGERPFIGYAINRMEELWNERRVFIVEAPTGYGKTTISAALALYTLENELKAIIAYPLRTLLEDQYFKFLKLINNRELLGKRYMHNPDSRFLIKPITLTTIDTLSLTLFGISPEELGTVLKSYLGTLTGSLGHYLFSWASALLSNIVLDEVHLLADTTKSLNFLAALIKIVADNDQRLILMSATIPNALKSVLKSPRLGPYKNKICLIEFNEKPDRNFLQERRKKEYRVLLEEVEKENKFEAILKLLGDRLKIYDRAIVVFNTVSDAVSFYAMIRNSFPGYKKVLLHSRFSESDRERKTRELKRLERKYIIVSTQVIEAGIDISSNLFITEIAPANSLIQRLGRFLRYPNENEGEVIIWYEREIMNLTNARKYKVYDLDLVKRTLNALRSRDRGDRIELNVHDPQDYTRFLDDVYKESDFRIDMSKVNKLFTIVLDVDRGGLKAAGMLIEEFRGSFVREGNIIPVIAYGEIRNKIMKDGRVRMTLKELAKVSVPVSSKLLKKNLILGYITVEKSKGDTLLFEEVKNGSRKYYDLLEHILRKSIVAYVIDAEYNSELGLVVRKK